MKIARVKVGAILLALFSAVNLHAQNVGIGFSSSNSKLTVNGNFAVGADYNVVAPTNGALIEGNVGLGITTPQVPLHLDGQEYVAAGGVTGEFWLGTANQDGVQINPGWIGIQRNTGTGTGYDLHLSKPPGAADGDLAGFFVNGSVVGSITTNGTSVTFNTTSDVRLKDNIRPTTRGLNDVMRIQVTDFNFKSKPGTTETGFIAQQLYTVLPEVVTRGGTNPATEPWTVDYGRVTPLLTKAIQDQQSEIDTLKNQQAALKAENAQLKAQNAKLAAMATEMDALKQAVTTLQRKQSSGVQPASLGR